MGPGQYPQYTRAPFGEEAVGSSQTKHHSTPPAQHVSPTYILGEMKVRHGGGVNVTGRGGAVRQTTCRGGRRSHAADPDADAGKDDGVAQLQIADCPVPVPEWWCRRPCAKWTEPPCTRTTTKRKPCRPTLRSWRRRSANEASTLPSVVRSDAPLHDESVTAVRDMFLDASGGEVSGGRWLPVPQ